MQVLWIRLGCTLNEIQGKSTKETIERAGELVNYTYWFTLLITVASTVCAVYMSVMITLDYDQRVNTILF
jgi:hypothetical protein